MDHREQQHRVGARPDEQVAIGALRRLGAPRIEDDHAAAAGLDRLEPPPHVRRRHEAAVRRERVRAQADEQIAPLDVRHRHEDLVAEHRQRREHVRQLIHGGRRVLVLRAERAEQELAEREQPEVAGRRVALVHADRVAAVARGSRSRAATRS